MQVDIEMLFQNVATLELVVELILQPEATLAMLRAEVEKHRVNEPSSEGGGADADTDGASGTDAGGGAGGSDVAAAGDDKVAPEPEPGSAKKKTKKAAPAFVDADDSVDQKKQTSSPCSNSGCVVS